jgi:hypothetical protein
MVWPNEALKALESWKIQGENRRNEHLRLAHRYKNIANLIQILGIILGTAGTGIKGTLELDTVYHYLSLCLTGLSVVLITINQCTSFATKAEKHSNAVKDYEAICRLINQLLILPDDFKGNFVTTLNDLRAQFDNLCRKSPLLSQRGYQEPGPPSITLVSSGKISDKVDLGTSDLSPLLPRDEFLASTATSEIRTAPSLEMMKIEIDEDKRESAVEEMDRQIEYLKNIRDRYQRST